MSRLAGDDPTVRHDILRLLAYHREDYERSVLRTFHERNKATDVIGFGHYPSLSALGALDVLPVEMLNEVLGFSDLLTISMLRLVNRRARVVVEAFIPYKLILIHAPHLVDVLTKTGVASHFTAVQIYDVLCSSLCAICGRFGAFLWIPDCIRCCFPCVRGSQELMPMTELDAKAAFGLSRKTLANVPIVETLPGVYCLDGYTYKRKLRLLSQARARHAAIVARGGEEGLAAYINSNTSQAKLAYEKRMARRNAESSYDYKGEINNTFDAVSRFMVTTLLPHYDPKSHSAQIGMSCKGCQAAFESNSRQVRFITQLYVLMDRRDQTFTEDMFLEHFKNCTDAQRMWSEHQRSNGTASR